MTIFPPILLRPFLPFLFLILFLPGCQLMSVLDIGSEGTGVSSAGISHLEEIRQSNGLSSMRADSELERAARRQASYMASAGRMAHDTGRGRDFVSRMRRDNVAPAAAENIAHGRMSVPRLFAMWMASEGHRSNMLDPRFERFGLAYAEGENGRRYWALVMN